MQNVYGSIKGIIHTAGVKPLDIEEYDLTNIKNETGIGTFWFESAASLYEIKFSVE